MAKIIDVKVIDGAVHIPGRLTRAGGTLLSIIQTGAVQWYLLVMLLGALGLMWLSLTGRVL